MARPRPPVPPVTMAVLPVRLKSSATVGGTCAISGELDWVREKLVLCLLVVGLLKRGGCSSDRPWGRKG